MNQRTISIIQMLHGEPQRLTITALAERFSVSQRTIRNDLNAVNAALEENGLSDLNLKTGGLVETPPNFEKLVNIVAGEDLYVYKLSQKERVRIAAALLTASSEYVTLSTIADNLFVSRATVIHDLGDIKALVQSAGMEVLSHPNRGLQIEGAESAKRLFLLRIAETPVQQKQEDMAGKLVNILAGNPITIRKIVSEQERIHKQFLTDDSFQEVVRYLGILVARIMQGEYVERTEAAGDSKYRMAQDILKYICQYCGITVTEDEVRFLSERLAKSRYIRQELDEKESVKIQLVTRQFIEQVSYDLELNLNDDYDFFENLSNHLESVFAVREPSFASNPTIDEVLEDNPDVLEAVNDHLELLEQTAGRAISPVEIGYIAVHICAAIERKKNREVAFHVIVACHAGIGTSQLLMEKLKKHFNFQIVDIISAHEAANVEPSRADLVIATVPLRDCKIESIVVSPLLTDEDYIRIGNKIESLRNSRNLPSRMETRELTAKGLIQKISPVVYQMVPDQAPELLRALKRVAKIYFNRSAEADVEVFAPDLHHLLPVSHIRLDVACTDWRDAVRQSAQCLLERGYIEERYIDAMIRNIEENGPYVVLSPGFAFPHEGVEQGSVKVGMSFIRLSAPVPFDAGELDPVEFVCCLSAVDHKSHLKALFNLVNMLKSQAFKADLRACATSKEAAAVIERYEYAICE